MNRQNTVVKITVSQQRPAGIDIGGKQLHPDQHAHRYGKQKERGDRHHILDANAFVIFRPQPGQKSMLFLIETHMLLQ